MSQQFSHNQEAPQEQWKDREQNHEEHAFGNGCLFLEHIEVLRRKPQSPDEPDETGDTKGDDHGD